MWRTNTDGQKTLCNACGVRLHREQKKSKASTTAQLREVVPPAPDSHAAVPEADSHLLLRSRAATCHAPAGPGTDQQVCACTRHALWRSPFQLWLYRPGLTKGGCCGMQRPIVFRGDVAAGYDGGLLRKRTSQEGRISPRPKASRTRSMPEPTARGIPTDTTISWIMQQLKVRAPVWCSRLRAQPLGVLQAAPQKPMFSLQGLLACPTIFPGGRTCCACAHVGFFAAVKTVSPLSHGLVGCSTRCCARNGCTEASSSPPQASLTAQRCRRCPLHMPHWYEAMLASWG